MAERIDPELQGRVGDQESAVRVDILRMKRDGYTNLDIANAVGLNVDNVRRIIRRAVDECRATERELVSERYHTQDARLECLYQKTYAALEAAPAFDSNLVRTLLLILDRSARLHGMDKTRATSAHAMDWLADATPAELIRMAQERGVRLPERFTVAG